MRKPWALCFALTLLVILGTASAEDAPVPRRSRIAATVAAEGGGGWEASLAASLARSPRFAAVGRVPAGTDPLEYAASRAFDLLVEATVTLSADGAEARFSASIREARTGSTLAAVEGAHPAPDEFALSQTFWIPVVAAAESEASAAADRAIAAAAAPPAPPASRWILETALYMGQYADLWFGRGFLSDRLFLKAGLSQFLTGVYLGNDKVESASYELIQPGLALGAYFNRVGAPLRPYAVVTGFYRLSGAGFSPDPIAWFGISAMLGGEWRLQDRTAAFFELGLSYYPRSDGYLLAVESASGSGDDRGPYSFEYTDTSLVEYPLFRIGLRLNP